jgi:hypothetical protein
MKKGIYTLGICLACLGVCGQPLPSPEQILGYPVGSQFTPYFQIVDYFRRLATLAPDRMSLETYGETNEGKPLILAFVSSPENMARLQSIRLNNVRLAGLLQDQTPADEQAPAIVWLTYNVHGNEAASSEAAMQVIWDLIDRTQAQIQEWLRHVLVVIDPCCNPDGRDRYVNWYRSLEPAGPNPDPQATEHHEPWPGGRSNHYYFDLNRDWVWQTQKETRARLIKYNAWLPQVHVDFHEQQYNNPYYFAPASEPYHEVITPWQREFESLVGKNNAKEFDQKGWLYFTREVYDLLYPGYGDTYPMYNGAIGMTFEQGGIDAGQAIETREGDTLRLADRVAHHVTTSLSAIAVSAQYAQRLVHEFRNYFTKARTEPAGAYKAYLLRDDPASDRMAALKTLLDRNAIRWEFAPTGSYSGVDYRNAQHASFVSGPGDIVINTDQPKSNLIRVLFERQAKMSDSLTYDISAWSVPLVYALTTFGLDNFLRGRPPESTTDSSRQPAPAYAYAVRWRGLSSARFLSFLLRRGVKVRSTTEPFSAGGMKFDRGTLIVTRRSMPDRESEAWPLLAQAAATSPVELIPLTSGMVDQGHDFGSSEVRMLHAPRVALMTGEGTNAQAVGEVWHFFEQELDYPLTRINAADAGTLNWANYDLIILVDGHYSFLADSGSAEKLKSWIRRGGKLLAMQGAASQLARCDFGVQIKNSPPSEGAAGAPPGSAEWGYLLKHYGSRDRDALANSSSGSIYRVDLDNSHPLAFGYPDYYYSLRQGDSLYALIREGGWNVGTLGKQNYVSGFVGVRYREQQKNGLLFGVLEQGEGQLIFLGDDPLYRDFWENGKLLFSNAVFQVGQ